MKEIHITDSRKRNSRVTLTSRRHKVRTFSVDSELRPVINARFVKGTLATDLTVLTKNCSNEELARKMIENDPEIDVELFGKRIEETSRIYLNERNEPAHNVTQREEVFSADGTLQEEREKRILESNINTECALNWGRLIPKKKFYNKFAFTAAYQLAHGDGLTYDFLFNMASELAEKDSFMMLSAGEEGNEPLVLSRNGTQYRAFLEGRIKDDKYLLMVHLTNLEMKPLKKEDA